MCLKLVSGVNVKWYWNSMCLHLQFCLFCRYRVSFIIQGLTQIFKHPHS